MNIKERLQHIAEAKRLSGSEIPWLCDTMEGELATAFGKAPNGEYILDPEGRLIRKRYWSNSTTLREDLTELVGTVENPTRVEDIDVAFNVETREIPSGIVPRLKLPKDMSAIKVEPVEVDETPFYAKLRCEISSEFRQNDYGKMYLGLYLDPLYKVHWNNRAGNVHLKVIAPEGVTIEPAEMVSADVAEDADVDPRMFLVDVKNAVKKMELTIEARYIACDDAGTFCKPVTQTYKAIFEPYKPGGTRPGIFLEDFFGDVADFDKNSDGQITKDELPDGKVTMFIGHLDKNFDDVIDADEIAEFMKMFNNGRGMRVEDQQEND